MADDSSSLPATERVDGQRGQTDAVPCSGFRTSATDKGAYHALSRPPLVFTTVLGSLCPARSALGFRNPNPNGWSLPSEADDQLYLRTSFLRRSTATELPPAARRPAGDDRLADLHALRLALVNLRRFRTAARPIRSRRQQRMEPRADRPSFCDGRQLDHRTARSDLYVPSLVCRNSSPPIRNSRPPADRRHNPALCL
jgi:hypothetical protein